ncbi:MAG TPA: family 43 glycosylhydrolase [Candidatus Dormibacteraeota bacterium]|nr:family 43 glycosylhydrolase [Candidatus Dormibacteraeota bacterium]
MKSVVSRAQPVISLISFLALGLSLASGAEYRNPVIPGDCPDPSIIRVGKEFWATATSSEWGPQFPLLHSTDLVNWEQAGNVFAHRPAWAVANFWAPEISAYNGKYYVYYVGRKSGGPLAVAVASAEKPGGPYTDHGPLVSQPMGSIDPVPVTDEKGERYLIWKEDGNSRKMPTLLWAQRLSEDGLKLLGQPKEIMRNDAAWEGAVIEGPFVVRRGDWFYLFYSGSGCCGLGCNYALGLARAKSLLGPWEKNPANPILPGNEQWKCPGHGSIVMDEQGRYWLLYHAYAAQNSIFTGREAMLDEVTFGSDDWPTINGGHGPSAHRSTPFGTDQKEPRNFQDDFSTLHAGWQWFQDKEPSWRIESGWLVLGGKDGELPGAVLARSTITGDYTASVNLDRASLKPGEFGGIAAIGDAANAIGLALRDGKLVLWRRDKGVHRQLAEVDDPKGSKLSFRVIASKGDQFRFEATAEKGEWFSVGAAQSGDRLPPWDRSIRVGLIAGGGENVQARFKDFEMVDTESRLP